MRRIAFSVIVLMLLCLTIAVVPSSARVLGPNGELVFYQDNGADRGPSSVYTVNPDGSHEQLLSGAVEHPHWSQDGTQVAMGCDSCGGSALIINPDTGTSRVLPKADPTLDLGCFWAWSPDGTRLACASFDNADPSRDGIYTVRSSDGGGLTRVTGFGGVPGDYSPDGKRISLVGADSNGDLHIYVVKVNGGALTAITPAGMSLGDEDGGSWSPTGDKILFVARPTPDSRRAIWLVNADGSGLRELPISDCGGLFADPKSIGCDTPVWSPDGSKIAFDLISAKTHEKNIYTVNPDGSGLFEVTKTGLQDFGPDWGTHPLTH